jgi:hypothetical protein
MMMPVAGAVTSAAVAGKVTCWANAGAVNRRPQTIAKRIIGVLIIALSKVDAILMSPSCLLNAS